MSRSFYFAAPFFCAKEQYYNLKLTEEIEKKTGHKGFLPQRDGFFYGNLIEAVKNDYPQDQAENIAQDLVYILDMGTLLLGTDYVIALVDEQIDEGVAVEISYAQAAGIPVLGIRSDLRAPFGNLSGISRGLHLFVAKQCNQIYYQNQLKKNSDLEQDIEKIIHFIDRLNFESKNTDSARLFGKENIVQRYHQIFKGQIDLNSKEAIRTILINYSEMNGNSDEKSI